MSRGKIVGYSESTEIYKVEIDNYGTYDAYCVSSDRLPIGDTVEVVDLDNQPPGKQIDNILRILPSRGGRSYVPTKRWYSANELESRGKKATLAKSWIFASKDSQKWQKDCPRYRLGTITEIIDEQDVRVDIYDPYEDKNVEHEARVDYMTCNATVFQVNDRVVCYFPRADIRFPVVVGFYDYPVPCEGWLYHEFYTNIRPDDKIIFLWDPVANDYVQLSDADGNLIEFPCEYDETVIEAIAELGTLVNVTTENYFASDVVNSIGDNPRQPSQYSWVAYIVKPSSWHTLSSNDSASSASESSIASPCENCICCPNDQECTLRSNENDGDHWFDTIGLKQDEWSGINPAFEDLTDEEYESREKRCTWNQTSETTGTRIDKESVILESYTNAVQAKSGINSVIGASFVTTQQGWTSRVRLDEERTFGLLREWTRDYTKVGDTWTPDEPSEPFTTANFKLIDNTVYKIRTPYGIMDTLLWSYADQYESDGNTWTSSAYAIGFANSFESTVSAIGRSQIYQILKETAHYDFDESEWVYDPKEMKFIATLQLFDGTQAANPYEDTRNPKLEQALSDAFTALAALHTEEEFLSVTQLYSGNYWVSTLILQESSRSSSSYSSDSSSSSRSSLSLTADQKDREEDPKTREEELEFEIIRLKKEIESIIEELKQLEALIPKDWRVPRPRVPDPIRRIRPPKDPESASSPPGPDDSASSDQGGGDSHITGTITDVI